jgi:hypothetical protein
MRKLLATAGVVTALVALTPPNVVLAQTTTMSFKDLYNAFLCIHKFEGAWDDPNAPYYGGLQMDVGFQQAYGLEFYRAWGTADHWPPSVQIHVAMRAYFKVGFTPWPNTRKLCNV